MKLHRNLSLLAILLLAGFGTLARSNQGEEEVKEKALDAPTRVASGQIIRLTKRSACSCTAAGLAGSGGK